MSMPHPPEPADEEPFEGPYVPEPPRRVPFAIALVTALLALISAALLAVGTAAVFNFRADEDLARSAGAGILVLALFLAGAGVAALAWSFVRNGNQIAAPVVGGLTAILGLIFFIEGLTSQFNSGGVMIGLTFLGIGLATALLSLIGDGPAYLAARRVWSKAEHAWLREMVAAGRPAPPPQPTWQSPQPWQTTQPPWQQPYAPQPYPAPNAQPYPGQPHPAQPHPGQPYPPQQPWPAQQQWVPPVPPPVHQGGAPEAPTSGQPAGTPQAPA